MTSISENETILLILHYFEKKAFLAISPVVFSKLSCFKIPVGDNTHALVILNVAAHPPQKSLGQILLNLNRAIKCLHKSDWDGFAILIFPFAEYIYLILEFARRDIYIK